MTVDTFGEGGVVVYRMTPSGYEYSQLLSMPPGMIAGDGFGVQLASDSDRLYVSSARPSQPNGTFRRGAVFIYGLQGTEWVLEDWFEGPTGLQVGSRLTVDEGRIVSRPGQFTLFVARRTGGSWGFDAPFGAFTSSDGGRLDGEDGWLIVGDPTIETGPLARPGFVRAYQWNGTTYDLFQVLEPAVRSQTQTKGDEFGYSVDLRGDELLIGARGRARNGRSSVGGAYVFRFEGGQWVEKELLLPPPATTEVPEDAGSSVRITDGGYLVGAQYMNTNDIASGGVYVFERAFGEPLCDGVPNSTGAPAALSLYGHSSAAARALELRATGLPVSTFTLLATGQGVALTPFLGGGQGTLCIAAQGIRRLEVLQASAQGEATWQVDFATLPGTPLPGQTYHFQAWYRDQDPGPTSNLSSAVSVLLK